MIERPTTFAERLDRAVAQILAGVSPAPAAVTALGAEGRSMLEAAALLRTALVPPPVAPRFEARLGARLAGISSHDPVAWALGHPGRLIITGAVGSAVGVGVTAYAVWRSSRRSAGTRLWQR